MNLKDRFFEFCRQYPGAEDIGEPLKSSDVPTGMKIADFFFQVRTIVCEVKTLTTETAEKLVACMQENSIGPSDLPNGQHNIKQLFLQLHEGEKKYRKAMTLITTPLANGLDDAEKQIRDTKKLFDIPNSDGLLVILNDQVKLAGPPLIFERLGQRLAKTVEDGSPYHKNINHIVHIGENYTPGEENVYMNLSLANPLAPEANGVAAFVQHFMEAWAAFNGQTFTLAGSQHEKLLKESQLVITVEKRRKRP
jgi:hypothetical protein